ncbi:MAG: hypothetical protein NWF01_01695 [Candidatus Bathyarchaeota archaeon]|nr:hypothetical protein [Candidatus Bathyarchaeota archaeon]
MTQNQNIENQAGFLQSKFNRVFMMLITMILIFAGPTYVPYAMFEVAGINYIASILTGLVLFIAGLGLMVYLIKQKVIT